MVKVNIYITEQQQSELRKLAGKTGLKMSEIIRRAVDEHLEDKKQRYLLEEES